MRRDARTEGLRWLEQAEADREGARLLFEGGSSHLACFVTQQVTEKAIPARTYTRVVAEEALRLTDQALHLLRTKLRRAEPASQ